MLLRPLLSKNSLTFKPQNLLVQCQLLTLVVKVKNKSFKMPENFLLKIHILSPIQQWSQFTTSSSSLIPLLFPKLTHLLIILLLQTPPLPDQLLHISALLSLCLGGKGSAKQLYHTTNIFYIIIKGSAEQLYHTTNIFCIIIKALIHLYCRIRNQI